MIRSHRHVSMLAVLTVAGISATLLHASPAHAVGPALLQLAKGEGGPVDPNGLKNAGPGNEQAHSAYVVQGGKSYVVTVFMSSNVNDNDRPWQCKCSSVELDPKMGPRTIANADQVQLTSGGNGDRPCNHPRIASDGKNMIWTWGSDNNSNNTQTYVAGIDAMCKMTTDALRVSENGNNNEGAPDIVANKEGLFTAGYLSTGGNDISYALGLTFDGITINKTYLTKVVTPANIGRPTIESMGADRSLFCAAQGNNRPPEDGITCAVLDAVSGDVIQKQIIAASDPNAKKYANQPTIGRLDNGNYALLFTYSNGAGKGNDNNHQKGSNVANVYVLNATDSGFNVMSTMSSIGAYQTHAAICTAGYGMDGQRTVAVMTASNTGVGAPMVQFAKWDAGGVHVDAVKDQWQFGFYGDSGYLANIYGQNPHQQGRDFLRCTGDIVNPGHGITGGFMPDVETFVAIPHAGRIPGDPKNALFISFVPGKVDQPQTPDVPVTPGQEGSTSSSSSSTTGGGNPTTGATTGGDNPSSGAGEFPSNPSSPNGCACSVPGEDSGSNGLGALVGFGLAAFFASRRRKES